jgi:hypothetical protein
MLKLRTSPSVPCDGKRQGRKIVGDDRNHQNGASNRWLFGVQPRSGIARLNRTDTRPRRSFKGKSVWSDYQGEPITHDRVVVQA